MTRRESAGKRLVRLVIDDLGEVDQHRCIGAGQQGEGGVEHSVLQGGFAGPTEGSAEGKLAVQHPRRPAVLGLAPHQAEPDRGDPGSFEQMCERTHGARAQRSNGGEDHDVHLVRDEQLGCGGSGVEPQGGERVVELRAHERQVP